MDSIFGIDHAKLLMGKDAIHVAINMIVQPMGDDGDDSVTGVFQTRHGRPLQFGRAESHILVLGDAIIRPRLVIASNAFRGSGLNHLATSGFAEFDKWVRTGHAVIKPQD